MEPCARKLYQDDGGMMKTEGQVTVRISVGEFSIRNNVVTVDCRNDSMLGMGVLTCGGAWIDLAVRTMSPGEVRNPLRSGGECCRLSLATWKPWEP